MPMPCFSDPTLTAFLVCPQNDAAVSYQQLQQLTHLAAATQPEPALRQVPRQRHPVKPGETAPLKKEKTKHRSPSRPSTRASISSSSGGGASNRSPVSKGKSLHSNHQKNYSKQDKQLHHKKVQVESDRLKSNNHSSRKQRSSTTQIGNNKAAAAAVGKAYNVNMNKSAPKACQEFFDPNDEQLAIYESVSVFYSKYGKSYRLQPTPESSIDREANCKSECLNSEQIAGPSGSGIHVSKDEITMVEVHHSPLNKA